MARNRKLPLQILLGVALFGPALALGGVHPIVQSLCLLAAAALFLVLLAVRREMGYLRLDLGSGLFLGLALVILFQIIPWPAGLVATLSPHAHEIRARALAPLGDAAPAFMPFALDTTLTLPELGKVVFYLAIYWTAFTWTRHLGTNFVLRLIAAVGVVVSFVFLTHRIVMATSVYGFYQPLHVSTHDGLTAAPLLNPNHLAALLGMATTVTIGLAVSTADRPRRLLMIGVAGLLGGSLLVTLSRGGIIAFLVGQVLFIVLRIAQRAKSQRLRRGKEEPAHLAWLPLGLAASIALGFLVAQDAIVGEFVGGDVSKFSLFRESVSLIGLFPTTGIGRGGFWVAFPLISPLASSTTFTHVENAVLQLIIDLGIVAGGMVILTAVFLVARFFLHPPERAQGSAALAALVAFGLHNLVDFNLEVPGVTALAAALVGALCAKESAGTAAIAPRIRVPNAAIYGLAAAAAVLATILVVSVDRRGVDDDGRALRVALDHRDATAFAPEALRKIVSRHPADWYLPFIIGAQLYHRDQGQPLPWLARAIELNPHAAAAHFYIGRTLLRAGRLDQALIELRLATRDDPRLTEPAARELVRRHPVFAELAPWAVTAGERPILWSALARELARHPRLEEETAKADRAILSIDRHHPEAMIREARRLAERGDLDQARKLARQLGWIAKYGPSGVLLEAELLGRQGRWKEAADGLSAGSAKHPGDPEILRQLAWALQRDHNHDGAMAAAQELRSRAETVQGRAEATILEGALEEAEGRLQGALAKFRQAQALTPTNVNLLERIAQLSEQLGDHAAAMAAWRRLVSILPAEERYAARLKALEDRAKRKEVLGE